MRQIYLLLFILCTTVSLLAQEDSYHIKFKIDNYDGEILTIANNMLQQQYVVDTVKISEDGYFHFRDTTELPKGIYLAVMAPKNDYFQFLVGNEEPFFELSGNKKDLSGLTTKNSRENKDFFDYLAFLEKQRRADEPLRAALKTPSIDPAEKARIEKERAEINEAVEDYQQKLIQDKKDSFVAAIVKANQPIIPPDFEELPEDKRRERQWRYMQKNYFQNINLKDERLLRTPFLFERIDYFIHKLHVKHPDTIALAIHTVLQKMKPGSDMLKVYLSHYLNEAARSKIVGMDGVYVFLIDNYYSKGLAPWSDEETLRSFRENADRLRPILIGKTAPDIKMQRRDGSEISLHEVKDEYTVLYFWRYDCGHCKESTPKMQEFHNKWKDKGVSLFAVCAKVGKEVPPCWEYIDEQGINDWLHTVDPYLRSRYVKLYDVQSTPAIFVLDKDKKIISKRIGAEQLDELLMQLTDEKAMEEKIED